MAERQELLFGALQNCFHLCVDMQRMFAEETDWHAPWAARVTPRIARIVAHRPERTIFTRFVPAQHAGQGQGTWRRYYERWSTMTIDRLGAPMIDIVEPLARFVPPAAVLDKTVYSPWLDDRLDRMLKAGGAETLAITGGETDVCVLAAVLGAVDRGFRVIVVSDALCSSSDETHDRLMDHYRQRFGQQVETVDTQTLLEAWV